MPPIEFRSGVYRHYRGNHYLALGLAREDETNETVVVYTRLYPRDGIPMSTRRLTVWAQWVDPATGATVYAGSPGGVPRFVYVGQEQPAA